MKTLLILIDFSCGLLLAAESASAQIWTQTMSNNATWLSAASSADGTDLVAVGTSGIYTSTNSGDSWNLATNAPGGVFYSVASSADGTVLALIGHGGYVSTNSGLSWTNTGAPLGGVSVASSADGSRSVAVFQTSSLDVYVWSNSWTSWQQVVISNMANAFTLGGATCSADGTKMAACLGFSTGLIRLFAVTSTNAGISWEWQGFPETRDCFIASSSDGGHLFLLEERGNPPDYLYASTNWGASWTTNLAPGAGPIVCSADASQLVVGPVLSPGSVIYTSTNWGLSWNSNSAPYDIIPWASSADGNKVVALGSSTNGGIWISDSAPMPKLNLTSCSNGLAFSWLVPSTNFVLQENPDLTTTHWLTLTNSLTLNLSNLNDEVVLSPTGSSGFFRLTAQ